MFCLWSTGSYLALAVLSRASHILGASSLLGHSCSSVRIAKLKIAKSVDFEFIGCLVTNLQICECLENLLKRSLTDRILLDLELLLVLFELSKEIPNCLVFPWNSHLVEITALFHQLDLWELVCEVLDKLESILLDVQELYEIHETNFTICIV